MRFVRKPRFCLIAVFLVGTGTPLWGQDIPDLTKLPALSGPGTLAAQAMPDQGFWLDVAQPGLYDMALDGAGLLGLTDFQTPNGRSDGSDPQVRLIADGSAYATGHMDDLFLVPGHAYLVQIAGLVPRGVTLTLDTPIDPASALTGDAIPGISPDAPLVLDVATAATQSFLVRPDGPLDLNLTSANQGAMRLDVLTPPKADTKNRFEGMVFDPSGIFPVGAFAAGRVELDGQPGLDGSQPLYLLRASALQDPSGFDENEPGDTDLGVLPEAGRSINGVLLARTDRDTFLLTLNDTATFDLGIEVPDSARNFLVLRRDGVEILTADFSGGLLFRPGLTLAPGAYQIDLSGDQDQPRSYSINLVSVSATAEGEPDDRPELARSLPEGQAMRGTLGPDNPGNATFDVSAPGHLWELRAVQGLAALELEDKNGTVLGVWEAASGAMVLRLALPPGSYVAHLRGDGPYALRLSDLGQAPEGFESEPDDTESAALRLSPGMQVTGDFQSIGDTDFYEFILAAPTPLKITATGPDDGPIVVDILAEGAERLRAEMPMGAAPFSYAALYPAGRYLIRVQARQEGISGRYQLQIERTDHPEIDEPGGVSAMPGDGLITGQIGGFDIQDRIFLPLAQGSGTLAIACQGALRSWEVWTYGDEVLLARAQPGETAVLPYGPETGGALGLYIDGDVNDPTGTYDCRLRFPPGPVEGTLTTLKHDEAVDESQPIQLTPGSTITGQFDSNGDRDTLVVAALAGQLHGLRCDIPIERLRGDGVLGAALNALAMAGDIHPFLSGADPSMLEINPPLDGAFPQTWTCSLLTEAAFFTPAMMGPVAAFTGFDDPAADPAAPKTYDPSTTLNLLSGGRPDWLNPTQVTSDLKVGLLVTGLDTSFRAYDRLGQFADLNLIATNPGPDVMGLHYQLTALGDGWRVTPSEGDLVLAPRAEVTLPLTIELPPMQSPITDPQLMVSVRAKDTSASLTIPVTLTPTAAARGPHRFWTAPQGLRGGLNPMLWQLGARLIALDGAPVDAEGAERFAFLHDGEALHAAIPSWFRAHDASFQLAEEAPISGFYAHLRTTEYRSTWPGYMVLELSLDGQTWQPAGSAILSASDLPQVFALAAPIVARFARITIPGCRTDPKCADIALSDVGLIASPTWRGAAPMDLADPVLGGHVVWAQTQGGTEASETPFEGYWNADLLTTGRPDHLQPVREDRGDRVVAVISFHGARAGRVAAVEWQGAPSDIARLDGADVEVSVTGPGGPWQSVGRLLSPPSGSLSARLELADAVWARAVRLTFHRDPTEDRDLPDRIRIWEDPTAPPLLGLWEDDRPEAGYEATEASQPVVAQGPRGGPDQDHPATLSLGQTVASSVQLETNADWWRIDLPDGPPRQLALRFAGAARPEFAATLTGPDGAEIALSRKADEQGDLILTAPAQPGSYLLAVHEPPRSVAILWDTSGSVQAYVPGILAAVRLWSQSLVPGRDRLQLLPFGQTEMLLDDWAGTPEEIYPALGALPYNDSSDSEAALGLAAQALAGQDGQRGIVVLTDAETAQSGVVWGPLLQAQPRVVALSIDTSQATGVTIMKDWASLNGGYFARITGNAGLADGLDLAAALFRAPKSYVLTASADELREPVGAGNLHIRALPAAPDAPPTGGIEVILDASGSMLKRMADGQRRIAVAHDALSGLVQNTLPEGTPFAFRAFGLAVDACNSELVVPLGPLQRDAAAAAIRDVPAVNGAKTAIAASLALAAQDLAAVSPPRVVVLLTDGEETCDGDVGAEIARLAAEGLDLRLTIVGFAIDDAELSATFAAWAQASGGQYLSAGDKAGLDASISQAILPRFGIDRLYVDGRVEEVGVIGLDQDMTLPAGSYRLRPLQTAQGGNALFDIADGARSELTYDPTLGFSAE